MTEISHLIAWQGQVELLNAAWAIDVGRTVEFRIVEEPNHDGHHPFRAYQKRRGGKLGQRFHLTAVREGETVSTYDSDVMFAGWTDSDRGRTIKFWIDEEASNHPFAGASKRSGQKLGTIYAAVFVALQDDEQPEVSEPKRRKLSQDAHLIITNGLFVDYLKERVHPPKGKEWNPELARRLVKYTLKVESLSDLDRDEEAAKRFHEEIRIPFLDWQGKT